MQFAMIRLDLSSLKSQPAKMAETVETKGSFSKDYNCLATHFSIYGSISMQVFLLIHLILLCLKMILST